MAGGLAVNGLRHHEAPAVVPIDQPPLRVFTAGLGAHRDEERIVESLRPRDVVAPDHDMAEHSVPSSTGSPAPTASAAWAEHGLQSAVSMTGRRGAERKN